VQEPSRGAMTLDALNLSPVFLCKVWFMLFFDWRKRKTPVLYCEQCEEFPPDRGGFLASFLWQRN
jgi:hypothetical protein